MWYFICGWPIRFFCVMFFRMRFYGVTNVPKRGGFLLLGNHQSFIDPLLVVAPINRVCAFAIRNNLYRAPVFGWLLLMYSSVPIKRGQADLTAIKGCIEKLKAGYGLVLYPEGTRTNDGKIGKIKPGFGLLARKANVPIIPVIVDGAFECWPKHNIMFSLGRVFVQYGKPIQPEEIISIGDREFAKYLTKVLRNMQSELRLKVGREPFDYQNKPSEKPDDLPKQENSAVPVSIGASNAAFQKSQITKRIKKDINYIWYCLWRVACRAFCRVLFNPKAYNLERVPEKGGFLLLSNHQSFLDPMLNANPFKRQCCFAARDTLFKVPVFGRLVHTVNAIPIKRDQADLTAMKMFLEKLKDGYGLVLYPEGTRTTNGKIAEIKPGFGLLARKANVPIIPSVIDGAYECWPKQKKLFSSGEVYVTYGQPIPAQKVAELGDREFAKYLTKILRDMQAELRLRVGRKPFDYQDIEK